MRFINKDSIIASVVNWLHRTVDWSRTMSTGSRYQFNWITAGKCQVPPVSSAGKLATTLRATAPPGLLGGPAGGKKTPFDFISIQIVSNLLPWCTASFQDLFVDLPQIAEEFDLLLRFSPDCCRLCQLPFLKIVEGKKKKSSSWCGTMCSFNMLAQIHGVPLLVDVNDPRSSACRRETTPARWVA